MWSAAGMGEKMSNKLVTWEMFKKYHEQLVGHIEARDGLTIDGEEIGIESDEQSLEETEKYYDHLMSVLPDHLGPLMPLEFEEDVDGETIG